MRERVTRESVKILPFFVTGDGFQVILGRSRKTGSIKPIGGGVNTGETFIQAAGRETREETTLEVALQRFRPLGHSNEILRYEAGHGLKPGDRIHAAWYSLALHPGETLAPDDDLSGLLAVPLLDLPRVLTHSTTRDVVRFMVMHQLLTTATMR